MSLIARAPSNLSSSASESPGKKSYGSQSPWSAKAEKDDRTAQPVVDRDVYSARHSRWDDDKAWSSQEWKADKSMDDRTGLPVVYPQRETRSQQFIIGDDETESELSLGSFLKRVNDQVRKRQKRMNVTENDEKFYDMGNVHVCNIGVSSIHAKELLGQLSFHHERPHIETNV